MQEKTWAIVSYFQSSPDQTDPCRERVVQGGWVPTKTGAKWTFRQTASSGREGDSLGVLRRPDAWARTAARARRVRWTRTTRFLNLIASVVQRSFLFDPPSQSSWRPEVRPAEPGRLLRVRLAVLGSSRDDPADPFFWRFTLES
jgi:hypothetical protein